MPTKYEELVKSETEEESPGAAEEEQAAAEEEEEAAAEEPESEPTSVPEPEVEPSAQALMRKLDSENTRHAKTLARLMEVDVATLKECPTCATYGFLPPGHDATEQFRTDPEKERCDVCDGYGLTRTGAQEPGEKVYQCSKCGGRGWTTRAPMPEVQVTYHQPPPEVNGPVAPPGYILVPTGTP